MEGMPTIFNYPLSLYPQPDIASKKENGGGGGETDYYTDSIPIHKRP